jgi:hypothetical protein
MNNKKYCFCIVNYFFSVLFNFWGFLVTIKAFVITVYLSSKQIVRISRILLTNAANMCSANACHHFLVIWVFFLLFFSFLVSLPVK